MRVYDPNHKPSKEVSDYIDKYEAGEITIPELIDKPCFITEDMEREWLAQGIKLPLPPEHQRHFVKKKDGKVDVHKP